MTLEEESSVCIAMSLLELDSLLNLRQIWLFLITLIKRAISVK